MDAVQGAVLSQEPRKASSEPGIRSQTERLQGVTERLTAAVDTLEAQLAMLLTPARPGDPLSAGEPDGVSDHAVAMYQCNNSLERQIDRIQELSARVDH